MVIACVLSFLQQCLGYDYNNDFYYLIPLSGITGICALSSDLVLVLSLQLQHFTPEAFKPVKLIWTRLCHVTPFSSKIGASCFLITCTKMWFKQLNFLLQPEEWSNNCWKTCYNDSHLPAAKGFIRVNGTVLCIV